MAVYGHHVVVLGQNKLSWPSAMPHGSLWPPCCCPWPKQAIMAFCHAIWQSMATMLLCLAKTSYHGLLPCHMAVYGHHVVVLGQNKLSWPSAMPYGSLWPPCC